MYKVGRSLDAGKRVKNYGKGSIMQVRMMVSNMVAAEVVLKRLCSDRFIERSDFGSEYFEGELANIISAFLTASALFPYDFQEAPHASDESAGTEKVEVLPPPPDVVPSASSQDPTVLLCTYVREHLTTLSHQPVDSSVLLDSVAKMLREAGCLRKTFNLKSLVQDLSRYFGAKQIMSHMFADGMRHALVFKQEVVPPPIPLFTTKLSEFMSLPDSKKKCSIKHQQGCLTWADDFESAFEAQMGRGSYGGHTASDQALRYSAFASLGYGDATRKIVRTPMCKTCGKPSKTGCCMFYSDKNRIGRYAIYDMCMTRL